MSSDSCLITDFMAIFQFSIILLAQNALCSFKCGQVTTKWPFGKQKLEASPIKPTLIQTFYIPTISNLYLVRLDINQLHSFEYTGFVIIF